MSEPWPAARPGPRHPPTDSSRGILVVMTGAVCTGKSTIAATLADELRAPIFSVDPLEAVLMRLRISREHLSDRAAYDLAAELAEDLLRRGLSVVVDAVNAYERLRRGFLALADPYGSPALLVQTVCSDPLAHRRLLEARKRKIEGFPEPKWEGIQPWLREYEPCSIDRLVLDAVEPLATNRDRALTYVRSIGTWSS